MRKKPMYWRDRKYAPPPEEDEDEDDYEEDVDEDEEHDEYAEEEGYDCYCYSCTDSRKEASAKKSKIVKIVGRVARAKNFVDTYLAKLDDWIGEEKYSECNIINNTMDFSSPKKYFVHLQHERAGCFGGEGKFMNKPDIMKMLQNQLEHDDYRNVEDRIVIFDTQINKVVKPKVTLQ